MRAPASGLAILGSLVLAACGGGAPTGPRAPRPAVATGSGSASVAVAAPVAAPAAVTWDQLHGPIESFTITGADDLDYLRLQPLFRAEVGRPIDRVRLRDQLDAAMENETLADVQLSGEQLATGVRLTVHVVPQAKVATIVMRDGAGRELPVPPELSAMVGARLAPADLDKLADRVREGYASAGHAGFAVSWHHERSGSGEAVTFVADPGDRVLIASRTYQGAKHAKTADLDHALAGSLGVGSAWIPELVERGALLISAYYWDHGFANVHVKAAPRPDHPPAALVFQIEEGDLFRLGDVLATGVPPAQARGYLAQMTKVKRGVVFDRTDIAAARTLVNDDLVKRGDAKVDVQVETQVDVAKKTIALTFVIKPGTP